MTYNLHRGFAMDTVSVELEHCYGIKALSHNFDFSQKRAFAIYAPNGAMKSSFAHTLKDLSEGTAPRDRIFPDRATVARVIDEQGNQITGDRILVVESYDDKVCPSEKHGTLLVEPRLREQYLSLQARVGEAKQELLSRIKAVAKSKTGLESEISSVLANVPDDLRRALNRVKEEVKEQSEAPFANVEWDKVFSDSIVSLLNTKDLKSQIAEYIERYDELLEKSAFFRKGLFDYYNADQVASNLAKNGFFKASHTVQLKSIDRIVEINTEAELKEVIEEERRRILEDEKLVARLTSVQAQLDKNADTRAFRAYLMDNMFILSNLNNVEKFKEDVIKSYLKVNQDAYLTLLDRYEEVKEQEAAIFKAADEQRTQWEEVIDIFNRRFVVPFTLHVDNRADVVAGKDKLMKLGFTYVDPDGEKPIERDKLLEYLSNGEKKAFYILQVIFEIERRRAENQETLFIIDDLADSFDYQNKYAIVEYLRDISQQGTFKQIILTHNFDFLRTIQSRFVGYAKCLMGLKSDDGMRLVQAEGIQNVFVNDWKVHFYEDDRKKIASIAFLRNLVEFSRGMEDPAYLPLTSMLHWRPETATLTVADLDALWKAETHQEGTSQGPDRLIVDLINQTADACLLAGDGLNLENKVVLAIATRMRAERFIAAKLNDPAFLAAIDTNQTWKLVSKFKQAFPGEQETGGTLDRVLIMTPENIHLNSFMYEPLIDMSEGQLRRLYEEVKALA